VVPPKEKLAKFGYNQKKNVIFWLHPRSYGLNMANSAFFASKYGNLQALKKKKKKTPFVEFAMPLFSVAKW
jgi:hypothetical protein